MAEDCRYDFSKNAHEIAFRCPLAETAIKKCGPRQFQVLHTRNDARNPNHGQALSTNGRALSRVTRRDPARSNICRSILLKVDPPQ